MKTVVSGRITQRHLDDANFLAGIEPTSFVHNGSALIDFNILETEVDPPSPMLPDGLGEAQRNYTMCLSAEALICVGENPHLVGIAKKYNLKVYEAAE